MAEQLEKEASNCARSSSSRIMEPGERSIVGEWRGH